MKTNSRIALILAVLLILSTLLIGCGGSTNVGQNTTTNAPTSEKQPPIEISACFWDLQEFGNDEIGKKIQEDTNIKLTVMPMDWGNEVEMKLLWAASGTLPDIISTYTIEEDITRFYNWQTNGLTRTIPEEIIAKYPLIKSMVDNNNIVQAVKQSTGGKILFIPRPFSLLQTFKFDQGCGYFYRKDWLKNVGITKEPATVDEFYEMLKRFTNNDPDQNGKPDTYGMVLNGGIGSAIFSWWGADGANWVNDNGTWLPGYLTDQPIVPLQFLNKLFKEKLIDPEFATNSNSQSIQKFASGNFGVFFKNVDDMSIYNVLMKNFASAQNITGADKVLEKVGILGPITKAVGDKAAWPAIMDTSGTEISAKVTDEKLERILGFYEYLMKPEIKTMLKYGFEGKEYVKNGDKIIPMTNPNTGLAYTIGTIYPSANIAALATWDIDADLEGTVLPQPIKDLGKKVRDQFNPIAKVPNLLITVMSTPAKDTTYVDTKAAFNNLVMTKGDVEKEFKIWRDEVKAKGMAKAIEEVNAKAKELNIK